MNELKYSKCVSSEHGPALKGHGDAKHQRQTAIVSVQHQLPTCEAQHFPPHITPYRALGPGWLAAMVGCVWRTTQRGGAVSVCFLVKFQPVYCTLLQAFLDPGNLEGDLQAGANTKYSLLWLLLWATVRRCFNPLALSASTHSPCLVLSFPMRAISHVFRCLSRSSAIFCRRCAAD